MELKRGELQDLLSVKEADFTWSSVRTASEILKEVKESCRSQRLASILESYTVTHFKSKCGLLILTGFRFQLCKANFSRKRGLIKR